MYSNERILVRQYVRILQKYYTRPWQLSQLEQLESLKELLGPRHGVLSYLRLDCIAEKRKYDLIMKAIYSLQLADVLEPLLYVLKKNKNLVHLHSIISKLVMEVKKQLHVEDIIIYSAYPLQDKDRKKLEEWIKQEQHAHIIRSQVIIKPELIAGFRIEGHHFMADYSVHRTLHKLPYLCLKERHLS